MRGPINHKVRSELPFLNQHVENESTRGKTLGFAFALIFGIGGLTCAAIGVGGLLSVGSLTHLGDVNSLLMLVIGGGGGIALMVVGIVGLVKPDFQVFQNRTQVFKRVSHTQDQTQFEEKQVWNKLEEEERNPNRVQPAVQTINKEYSHSFCSFQEYCQKRARDGGPVDLIVGRGRKHSQPILNDQRYFPEKNEITSYLPFMIDMDVQNQPDYAADISNFDAMSDFPNASVDEIYLEDIFPVQPQLDLKTYCNVVRILKLYGVFIMDTNCLCRIDQVQNLQEAFNTFFRENGIPLMSYCDDRIERNDSKKSKLAFIKYDEYEIGFTKNRQKLSLAQQKLKNAHSEATRK